MRFNQSQEHATEPVELERQPTGLELDDLSARVAVALLGHKWLRSRDDKFRDGKAFLCSPKNLRQFEERYVEADNEYRHSNDRYWAEDPARDIAAAMEVLPALRKRLALSDSIVFWCKPNSFIVQIWADDYPADTELANVLADTLPQAICHAALASIEASNQHAALGGTTE